MTTLRKQLEAKLKIDIAKVPKKYWNVNDDELHWDNKRVCYVGKNDKKEEIVASIQHTSIPFFNARCPNLVRKGNIEDVCQGTNHVSILQDNQSITCQKCGESFTVSLVIPETCVAYTLQQALEKEGE